MRGRVRANQQRPAWRWFVHLSLPLCGRLVTDVSFFERLAHELIAKAPAMHFNDGGSSIARVRSDPERAPNLAVWLHVATSS